jgi:lysophospholipase L1-like esterase
MRIALIGDSQSEALWPRVQKAMPQHQFVLVRTQRGWESVHYKKEGKLEQQLKDAKPELVVIELGGNNFFVTEDKYRPYVDWMLSAARQSGAKHILWIGPATATKSPNKENKEWTNAFQKQYIGSQPDVTWFDSFPYTLTGHVDGVHFGSSTYGPWSQVIVTAIETATKKAEGGPLALVGKPAVLFGGVGLVALALLFVGLRRRRRIS